MNLAYNIITTILLAIGAMIATAVLVVIPAAVLIAWLIVRSERPRIIPVDPFHDRDKMIQVRAGNISCKIIEADSEELLVETLGYIKRLEEDYPCDPIALIAVLELKGMYDWKMENSVK